MMYRYLFPDGEYVVIVYRVGVMRGKAISLSHTYTQTHTKKKKERKKERERERQSTVITLLC